MWKCISGNVRHKNYENEIPLWGKTIVGKPEEMKYRQKTIVLMQMYKSKPGFNKKLFERLKEKANTMKDHEKMHFNF